MELVYLLISMVTTTFTSLILSLLLPFRYLLHRPRVAAESVILYQGTVWHERRRPVHHSFSYPVRYALFDLDGASHAPPNHLSADEARRVANTNGPVCALILDELNARRHGQVIVKSIDLKNDLLKCSVDWCDGIYSTTGFLLTIPPSVGYEQNPLSLYYCYDFEASKKTLRKCIAEVTNTPWGERVSFLFNPSSDLVAKSLHVSPFMDMLGNWSMKTNEPGDNLHVVISVQHPKLGNYFTASLTVKRVTPSMSGDHTWFFWLMPHKVALWIYWHALKLWWKNVPLIQHPRYPNPAYKEEALLRDETIRCCQAFGGDQASNVREPGRTFDQVSITENIRCCTWTDASWPWC